MDFLSSIFGSKPQVASYTPVNLQADQLKALQGDIASWDQISSLGNLFQQYMLNQYDTAFGGPGAFRNLLQLGGQNVAAEEKAAQSELSGQLPPDVQAAVQRASAQQNLTSGLIGSSAGGANAARNLGLTSLDLIGKGANLASSAGNAAQRWAALSGAQMPEGMLVTPQQQAQLDMQQNLIERNIQQQRFNVAAAPNPAAQALNQWVEQVGGSIVASYAGAGGGKPSTTGSPSSSGSPAGNYATSYNPSSYGVSDLSQGTGATGGFGSAPAQGGYQDVGTMFSGSTDPYQSQIAPNPFGTTSSFGIGSGAPTSDAFSNYLNSMAYQQGAFGG